MSKLYNLYHHRYAVRRWPEMTKPRLASMAVFGLPRESVLHYLPKDEVEIGLTPDDPIISNVDRTIFVDFVTDLSVKEGSPRWNHVIPDTEIRAYYRRYRRFRRLRKLEQALRDPHTLLTVNYGLLNQLYRYTPSIYSRYYKWSNVQKTMWMKVNEMAKSIDRHHFIHFTLPTRLPTLGELMRAQKQLTKETLDAFRGGSALTILDLWNWLGKNRSSSTMSVLEPETLSRINLIWSDSGKWFFINLGVLNSFRKPTDEELAAGIPDNKGKDPFLLQKCMLKALMVLMEGRTVSSITEVDDEELELDEDDAVLTDDEKKERAEEVKKAQKEEDDAFNLDLDQPLFDFDDADEAVGGEIGGENPEDFFKDPETEEVDFDLELDRELTEELSKLDELKDNDLDLNVDVGEIFDDHTDKEPEKYLKEAIDSLADGGLLSGAEYRRLEKLSKKYKEIPNPFDGKTSLEEFGKINPEVVKLDGTSKLPELETVLDQSMLQSTVSEFDPRYIREVLPKDIVNMLLTVQKGGVMITDYEVEEVEDAINHYHAHSIKIVPVVGSPSTIRFRLPVVKEDGTYLANGVRYRLRKQRADMPIRKVSPSKVALTSYYGKVFVERTERSTNNYDKWLTNNIVAMGTDSNNPAITELRLTNTFDHLKNLPRVYSALAKRMRGFVSGEYDFYLDHETRYEYFGAEDVKVAESGGMTVIARKGSDLVVIDKDSTFYTVAKGSPEVIGKIEDIIPGLDNPPLEMAEINLFSKNIPLGLALGYMIGIDNLLKRLNIEPRRALTGERLNLGKDEFAVKFADEILIFSRYDYLATLIMSGFNRFHRDIREYSLHEYNRKDVYMNVLENNGVQIRYLRELDLLDKLFIDPITKELLVELKEPVTFIGLLFRCCELLMTDWHPLETDMEYQRIRGYERFAGAVYSELVRVMRAHNARPASSRNKVEMNPQAVWQMILQDPAQILVEDSNPVHNLKEKESVTFTGVGGRSTRSMVARTRVYNERDMGVISEGTVDSGDVGINSFLSPDANFVNLRGMTRAYEHGVDGATKLLSTSALLAPGADRDD